MVAFPWQCNLPRHVSHVNCNAANATLNKFQMNSIILKVISMAGVLLLIGVLCWMTIPPVAEAVSPGGEKGMPAPRAGERTSATDQALAAFQAQLAATFHMHNDEISLRPE